VGSAGRLHEFVETHAHDHKQDGRYWELVGLQQVGQAPSPESLAIRSEQAAILVRQQREYLASHDPDFLKGVSPKKEKRRARKKRQRQYKRAAELRHP
jgi:hypothetical protein